MELCYFGFVVAIITSIITLFIIMGISFIAKWCTRNSKKISIQKFNFIANKTFKITRVMLLPIIMYLKLLAYTYYAVIYILGIFLGLKGNDSYCPSYSSSSSSSSYDTSSCTTNYSGNNENNTSSSDEYSEKRFCHCNNSNVTTIDSKGRACRSDGVVGYKQGDYIYYNDGTQSRLVMLSDEKGFIE